jgi:hypothetical protein
MSWAGTAVERMKTMREARFGKKLGSVENEGVVGSSASKRADGIAKKGKTRGKMV